MVSLVLAHLPEAQATILVKHLLKANKKDRAWQRLLFLAATALAEGTEVADAPHRQVVDALLNLARRRGWHGGLEKAAGEHAIPALERLAGDGYAMASLLSLAQDQAVHVRARMGAAEALERLGRAKEAAETYLAVARDRPMGVVEVDERVRAAEALGRLGWDDEAAELLLALARDEAERVRRRTYAARALGRLGRAEEAAEAYLAVARDRTVEANERVRAAEALGRLGWAEEAAEAYLALGRDQALNARVRVEAAEALRELGWTDEAAELLLTLARDQAAVWVWVQASAATLLGILRRDDDLLALARDRAVEAQVRLQAAKVLGRLGRADEAAELLLALARDRAVGAWMRAEAARALGRLGRADEAEAELLALLQGRRAVEAWVRRWAAEALERLGRAARKALGWLIE